MLPTVEKLASEVAKAIEKPGRTLLTKSLTEGTKAAGKAATGAIKSSTPLQQKISDFKSRNLINSEDVAYACALVDILYVSTLEIKINNVALSKAKPDLDSFPAAFLFFGVDAVKAEDQGLDEIVKRLKAARVAFADVFPACVAAIFAKEYMDLKALAGKFTSMAGADVALVKDAIRTCQNGVEICDKGLSWAAAYDKTLDKWISGAEATKK